MSPRSWVRRLFARTPAPARRRMAVEALEDRALLSATFSPAVHSGAGVFPFSVAVGDFNGDGKPDLATADRDGSTVSVLLGNGNGTFQPAAHYSAGAGAGPFCVAVGDFNGDGKLDLTTANLEGKVAVLLGNGNGTFQPATLYGFLASPYSVAVGDFNGDGKPDLATANLASDTVSVLLGNGNGTFQSPTNSAAGDGSRSVAVGDFNGDGKPDLATADVNSDTVSVLLGNGNGTFQPAAHYGIGDGPTSVAVGDFNGDGKPDLAAANQLGDTVSVLLGNGNGTFQPAAHYAAGDATRSVTVGDLDGDGKPDLAAANQLGNTVSVLLGNGNGTFQPAANLSVGDNPSSVAVGDFNGDGRPDLAVSQLTSNSVGVLLNSTTAPTNTTVTSSVASTVYGEQVVVTAAVTAGEAVTAGTVTFREGGTVLAAGVPLNGSGQASFSISTLSAGSHTITADYSGTGDFQPSSGDTAVGVAPRALTVGATAENRTYDGSPAAAVTLSDNRVPGDGFTVSYTSANFADKNVGAGKTVTVSGLTLGGPGAGNYSLTSGTATTTANITARGLVVSATGVDRVYDGTTLATVFLSDNRVAGDGLTLSYGSASFTDGSVGLLKPVSVGGISIGGADAGNYAANTTAATTANIAEAPSPVVTTTSDVVNAFDNLTSLREAVAYANSHAGADTITFATPVAGGTMVLTGGPLDLTDAALTTIDGGAAGVTIDGNNSTRLFGVSSGASAALNRLTLSRGQSPGFSFGGGIENNGSLTVTASTFANNSAPYGGGIANAGTATVTASTFSNNWAQAGGGIYNYGSLTVTTSTFSNNEAPGYGGGIYNEGGLLTVTASTFANNSAGSGGGIHNEGTATVSTSTLSGNSASFGGGISSHSHSFQNTLTVSNSTLSGNSATSLGGGIYIIGTVTVSNSTLSGNSAPQGGGIHNSGTLTVNNSIVANQVSGGDIAGGYAGSHNRTGTVALGPLADNGGPTQTHALLPGSPAIGGGFAVPGVNTDQRGLPRKATPDIGAYETQAVGTGTSVSASLTAPVYGQALTFTAFVSPTSGVATGSVQFLIDGTAFGGPVALDGTGRAVSGSTTSLAAGSHTVTATYLPTGVFTGSQVQATFAVAKASLTVTADARAKVYGDAEPVLTYTVSGPLYNGDTAAVVGGVSLATATGAAAAVGTHPITVNGGTAANYDIVRVNGVLTVTPATLTVTADPKTKVFGQADPALTFQTGGFRYADTAAVLTGSLSWVAGSNVGGYAIQVGNLAAANYTISYTGATLTITPAAADIQVSGYTGTYDGQAHGATLVRAVGVGGADLSGFVTFGGSFTHAPGGIATWAFDAGPNYQTAGGTVAITITPRAAAWTTDPAGKTYGDADPAFTGGGSGFLDIDGVTAAYPRQAGQNVGTYGIVAALQSTRLTATQLAANYAVTNAGAAFTITPRVLTVSATASDKAYDGTTAANATLSFGNAAFGETPTATFAAAFRDKTAAAGKPVDVTGITLAPAFAANYTLNGVTAATATAAITPKAIAGGFTAADKVYDGGTGATVTGRTLSGAVGGDAVALTGGTAAFADKNSGVGKTVTLAGATLTGADANNYTLTGVATSIAGVSKRVLTVTATAADKVYDGTTAAVVTLSDDRVTGDLLAPGYTSATFNTPDVGTNKPVTVTGIGVTGADANNYAFNTTAAATASITPAVVTVGLTTDRSVAVPGLAVTFTATVAAVGGVPVTGTVTFRDGATVLGSAPVVNGVARHTTAALQYGTRTISAMFTGGTNSTSPTPPSVGVSVVPAAVLADPVSGQNALFVGGTSATDVIGVDRYGTNQYAVGILSLPAGQWPTLWAGTFSGAISRVVVYAGAGDDLVAVDGNVTVPVWEFGGDGNDTLGGGEHALNLLAGGAGNDTLKAGNARDILIGGAGADRLEAKGGDDLLVAGATAFDADESALWGVQLEWTSARSFATRVANLRGTGTGPRANGTAFLAASGPGRTVFDDGSADYLKGGSGRDWYFANVTGGGVLDAVSGLKGDDVVDDLP